MTAEQHLSRKQLVVFLGEMLLIRRFEEKVTERFRAGDLAGFLHACIGQEAVAVGVCDALANGDLIGSTHRTHGHVLANGTPGPTCRRASQLSMPAGCGSTLPTGRRSRRRRATTRASSPAR